ncbi:prephenate dehydratase [Staphylococcus caledonicus]
MKLYYLGPKGTFSYLAAKQYSLEKEFAYSHCPKQNLYDVVKSVADNDDAIGIVPLENSIEGTINIVADSLIQQEIYAHGEIHMNIDFGLYANEGNQIEDITKVYSIAPAISQTIQYIHQHQFEYDYVDSTIQGLEKISSTEAAIAPLGSGELYGFAPIDSHIQDYSLNVTRFLVIKNHANFDKDGDNTILVISPKANKAGLLAKVLNTFALFDINLSWIESRPMKQKLGFYYFFVQTTTGKTKELDNVISILNNLNFKVKIIGVFNAYS